MAKLILLYLVTSVPLFMAEPVKEAEEVRQEKVLPVFQVVKFPNDICAATTRNGTCYTAEECSNKGGAKDGSCASGFGVCCVFALSCGSSSSENQTYLVQTAVTVLASPCTYTICPCSTNICRIRYDFTTMVLATAVAGTTSGLTTIAAASTNGAAIGDCNDDQFNLSSGFGGGSPTICGTNTGYHMIIDSDGTSCQTANFNIGASTSTSRSWSVKVSQYNCGDYDNSGPPGCLQYYQDSTGSFQSYAFPTGITTTDGTPVSTLTTGVTHLQDQLYDVCFRRALNMCFICYSPTVATGVSIAAATQNSFGLGISTAAGGFSALGTECVTDWIEIPDGNTDAIAMLAIPAAKVAAITVVAGTHVTKFCGRALNLLTASIVTITICTANLPFRVGVHFDSTEFATTLTAAMSQTNEQSEAPGGIVGFKLNFWQRACL